MGFYISSVKRAKIKVRTRTCFRPATDSDDALGAAQWEGCPGLTRRERGAAAARAEVNFLALGGASENRFSRPARRAGLMPVIAVYQCSSHQLGCRAHLRSQKENQNTLAQINACEVFGFRCIVTGPRGFAEAMQLSSIRPVRSDGVIRNLTQHFR